MLSHHIAFVLIALIVVTGLVLRARYTAISGRQPASGADATQSREEIKRLKDRLAVLERLATARENTLEREIEQLRDR